MQLRRVTILFASLLLLTALSFSQTVAPAPTPAGYPFWATNEAQKITRGNDGAIYFAQYGHIGRLSLRGSFKSYSVNNDGSAPTGLTWGPDGNLWFGLFSGVVGKLNPSTGAITKYQLPKSPVYDITVGPDGALWAAASLDVYRITTSGSITPHYIGNTVSMLRKGPDGAMWMIQTFGHQIYRMTTSGTITNVWNLAGSGWSSCGPTCAGITAGPDGALWFTQNEQHPVIGRITTSGAISYFPLQGQGAGDIAWGHDGRLWFTDPFDKLIGAITTSGVQTYYAPAGQQYYSAVHALSSSPDGNIYFTGTTEPSSGITTGVGKIVLWAPQNVVGDNVYPTHGVSTTMTVGTFSDYEILSGGYFTATISWGDGNSSIVTATRTSSGSPNHYKISATHKYASKGIYKISVRVWEPGDQYRFYMNSQASVQ